MENENYYCKDSVFSCKHIPVTRQEYFLSYRNFKQENIVTGIMDLENVRFTEFWT